jgi:hypothetical protein
MLETYLPEAKELSAKNHINTTKKFLTYLLPDQCEVKSIYPKGVEIIDNDAGIVELVSYNDIAFNLCKPIAVHTFNTEIVSYQNRTFGVARYENLAFGGACEAEAVIKATMELSKLHWK